jgi:hypothetical protein
VLIQKKRIRTLDGYLPEEFKKLKLVIAKRVDLEDARLQAIGFGARPRQGDTVLPTTLGPVSQFNAEGKYQVHRDRPMETAYTSVEWSWKEWHGPYEVEKTDVAFRPYKRYPRTFIDPPSVELSVAVASNGDAIVCTTPIPGSDNESLLHAINLMLELFGECEILDDSKGQLIRAAIRRLNWRVLPPGERTNWETLERHVRPLMPDDGRGTVTLMRIEKINAYGPDFVAVGLAGFAGYLIFGFPQKALYVLESIHTENATYVLGDDWETLSKMSKAELLASGKQEARLIHKKGWEREVRALLESRNR